MSLLRDTWRNLSKSLWQREAVEKLDAHGSDLNVHYPDAPADGSQYARENNAWVPVEIPSEQIGYYDQVLDQVVGTGLALTAATNFTSGQYYTLVTTGVFSTALPELNGLTGSTGDRIVSNGTQWNLLSLAGDYLSSIVDDTAQGVIEFAVGATSSKTTLLDDNDLVRKDYIDGADAAHAALLAGADDVHMTKTYTDAAVAAHAGDANIHYPDAPADGSQYARKDNAWEQVAGGGGTTLLKGYYDQVADLIEGGGPLDGANNYTNGEYYILIADGEFASNVDTPELNNEYGTKGDFVRSTGTQWVVLSGEEAYLSSKKGDTADASILFSAGAKSNLVVPVDANELIRKDYVDAHVDDTNIHFPDDPNDGRVYGRLSNGWFPQLFGSFCSFVGPAVADGILSPSLVPINSYLEATYTSEWTNVDPAAGTMIVPHTGYYTIVTHILGNQNSQDFNMVMRLYVRLFGSPVSGDFEMYSLPVESNKTQDRTLLGTQQRLMVAGQGIQLMIGSDETIGTFSILNTTFGLVLMGDYDYTPPVLMAAPLGGGTITRHGSIIRHVRQ